MNFAFGTFKYDWRGMAPIYSEALNNLKQTQISMNKLLSVGMEECYWLFVSVCQACDGLVA